MCSEALLEDGASLFYNPANLVWPHALQDRLQASVYHGCDDLLYSESERNIALPVVLRLTFVDLSKKLFDLSLNHWPGCSHRLGDDLQAQSEVLLPYLRISEGLMSQNVDHIVHIDLFEDTSLMIILLGIVDSFHRGKCILRRGTAGSWYWFDLLLNPLDKGQWGLARRCNFLIWRHNSEIVCVPPKCGWNVL